MKIFITKYWKITITLLFGLAVFLFWFISYPFALIYQEQFQLFIFDNSYLFERLSEPGGVARYIAEFLVQFYNSVAIGSFILAVIFMINQRLIWILVRKNSKEKEYDIQIWYLLSFIPVILLWYFIGDENVMLSFVISLTLATISMVTYPKYKYARIAYIIFGIPLFYWIIGPAVLMLTAYITLKEFLSTRSKITGLGLAATTIAYSTTCILISANLTPYPLKILFRGIDYYRFMDIVPYLMICLMIVYVIFPLILNTLPNVSKPKSRLYTGIFELIIIFILSIFVIPKGFDSKTYNLIEYDYLVRIQDWDAIISKSHKQQPNLPMSVCATDLALAMTNQLGDHAFEFYQHGSQGLLPPFERNFMSALLTSEAYYQLGMINTAQRFVFESMEAIPNYNKSCRAVKRLAETNLINGQYGVARKYLRMLEKTIFYRKWAQSTMKLLNEEKHINEHPVYGKMRRIRIDTDILFSENEVDKILGQLFLKNKENSLAMQYLLFYPILDRNINKFMQYLSIVQKNVNYSPRICQEAIAFAYMQHQQQPPSNIVSQIVLENLSEFARIYTSMGKNSPQLDLFKNTCWYYLLKEK